ncbi:MAG: methionine biosynthesis protein MetW, partial [Planctomycetota bacterium]|nr:methionine biosynthesis protein MetW [Planctomycetota bacterium]
MLELRNCPVCDTIKEVCRVVHIRKDDKLYACPTCGVLFASPQYEPSELKHIYNKEFYNDDVTLHKGTTALGGAPDPTATETIRKALIKRYPALAAPGIKILDYGCGLGQFLATFKKYGADCLGIELSGVAAASARQRFGLNVIEGDEETLEELPDGEFQLIS